MKNLILALTLILISIRLDAQTVNNIPIKEIDSEHLLIVGTSKLMSNKVTINLDFGQVNKALVAEDTQVKDEQGNLMVFNSMIDALNFFSKYGYEFVDAYAITYSNGQSVYNWLMRKKG